MAQTEGTLPDGEIKAVEAAGDYCIYAEENVQAWIQSDTTMEVNTMGDKVIEFVAVDLTDTRVGGHRITYRAEGGGANPAAAAGYHNRIDLHHERVQERYDPARFEDGTVLARVVFEGDTDDGELEWVE